MTRRRKSNTNRQAGASSTSTGTSTNAPTAAPTNSGQTNGQKAPPPRRWYKADLHLHTPASHDYEEPNVSYLEWMRAVAARGLEIVAITDHNTVAGVGAIRREIEWLTKLESVNRLTDEESKRLLEWRELANQVLVLPGFEFTATFGFHILGIFPPETSIRHLELVLLQLKVPADKLDDGSTETGATTDVLGAYKIIHDASGLVIAAHANSTHGVAMRNFPFGGQTKIAYTQDVNLDAMEVTDLDRGPRSTARFFNGSKIEYARRMHCIHGSDAHRIKMDPKNPKRLGIGDRAGEFLLDNASFEAIVGVLRSKQFDRTRPWRPKEQQVDSLSAAREEGPTIVQSFHETASQRGGRLGAILNDICAFANTMGGTVYVGATHRKGKPRGLDKPAEIQQEIENALDERVTPPLDVRIDTTQTEGVKVLRIQVPKGPDRPYCLDDTKYYIRDEADSNLAVRDELVALVRDSLGDNQPSRSARAGSAGSDRRSNRRDRGDRNDRVDRSGRSESERSDRSRNGRPQRAASGMDRDAEIEPGETSDYEDAAGSASDDTFFLPQVGVEIVGSEKRNGNFFHSIRDLRNGHVIHNVTRRGARKLWNYAIQKHEDNPVDLATIQWEGEIGMIHSEKRAGKIRYDLALRDNGSFRVFYGVTEDGMEGRWSTFAQDE